MRDLKELDKLEKYLIEHRIEYNRYDTSNKWEVTTGLVIEMDRHQICVPEEGDRCRWDAICQRGSYGYDEGLLEIYGEIVDEEKDGDTAVGYLTAEDVIKRLEDNT